MKKATKNDIAMNVDSQSVLKPIENSKWNYEFDFESVDERYRSYPIKVYNNYETLLNGVDSNFFVSQLGGKSLIFRESKENGELTCLTHHDFNNHYGHKVAKKVVSMKKGEPVVNEVKYYMEWKNHKNRRQYNLGIKFYPGQLSEWEAKQYYNSWRGFPIEGKQGEFPKIEYHLKHVWCRDNIEHYNYLMAWLADIIQNPAEKKGTALVVKGGKGSGKSIIFEELLNKIFGYTYVKIDKAEQVTGKFNLHLQGKLFLVLEEAIWAGDKTAEGTLKSMITDTEFVLEGKGTNAIKSQAYFRMAFISNEKQAVPATKAERRFFALKVSDEYRDNTQYFNELVYEIRNGGVEAFMYHLQNLDISKINLRIAPRTEALFEDILAKMETIERYLYDLLHEEVLYFSKFEGDRSLWGNKVTKSDLFMYFEKWERTISAKNIYLPKHDITSQAGLTREINKIMPFKNTKVKGENAYELPSRDVARKMFESQVKSKVTWLDDESDNMVDEEYELMNREWEEIVDEDMKIKKRKLEEQKARAESNTAIGQFFA